VVRQHADRPRYDNHVDYKGAIDLVTEADREAEALIVEALLGAFPDHHFYGEEGGSRGAPKEEAAYTWIVDPLDGTTNFAHGLPHFAISIGLAGRGGEPLVGVVYDPMRDECFTAIKGRGAHLNGEPVRVSATPALSRALVCSGFPYDRWTAEKNNVDEWRRMVRRTQGVRRIGAAALELAYVAMGRLDLFWEQRLSPHDIMAGLLLVLEGGGVISDFDGGDAKLYTGAEVVASNGIIHSQALEVFQKGDNAPLPSA
jgi:myo-inositol-1(or 4)-monophosphatase